MEKYVTFQTLPSYENMDFLFQVKKKVPRDILMRSVIQFYMFQILSIGAEVGEVEAGKKVSN